MEDLRNFTSCSRRIPIFFIHLTSFSFGRILMYTFLGDSSFYLKVAEHTRYLDRSATLLFHCEISFDFGAGIDLTLISDRQTSSKSHISGSKNHTYSCSHPMLTRRRCVTLSPLSSGDKRCSYLFLEYCTKWTQSRLSPREIELVLLFFFIYR